MYLIYYCFGSIMLDNFSYATSTVYQYHYFILRLLTLLLRFVVNFHTLSLFSFFFFAIFLLFLSFYNLF